MFDVFKKYLAAKAPLTETDFDIIEAACIFKKLRKHQFLLQENDHWHYHAFVCAGCLRKYTMDDKGMEHTVYFAVENWWIGDRQSLMDKTPARYNIDALEDSVVLLVEEQQFQALCDKIPPFNQLINHILQRSLNASHERINATISLTAEERYLHFLKTYPDLANRVPRYMVASFLGITPETLSRVRRQLLAK